MEMNGQFNFSICCLRLFGGGGGGECWVSVNLIFFFNKIVKHPIHCRSDYQAKLNIKQLVFKELIGTTVISLN